MNAEAEDRPHLRARAPQFSSHTRLFSCFEGEKALPTSGEQRSSASAVQLFALLPPLSVFSKLSEKEEDICSKIYIFNKCPSIVSVLGEPRAPWSRRPHAFCEVAGLLDCEVQTQKLDGMQ